MKIAKVTPVSKGRDSANLSNYQSISVFPCFSKILKRLMYKCIIKYTSTSTKCFPKKPFNRSCIYPTCGQIYESFEHNEYTIGVFIDPFKAFETVDHNILLKK